MKQKARQDKKSCYNLPSWAKPLIALSFIILALQLFVTGLEIPTYIVPAPLALLKAIIANHKLLLEQLAITIFEAGVGFLLGNIAAIVLAIVFVNNKLIEKAVLPVAIAIRSIPIVAITPILTLVLGRGYATTISIVVLIVFFPTLVNTTLGLRSVSRESKELFDVLAASKMQQLRLLRMPTALPFIFSALKITGPGCILGALVAEWVATDRGIGFFILDAQMQLKFTLLWSAIVLATLLAVAIFALVGVAERHFLKWHLE